MIYESNLHVWDKSSQKKGLPMKMCLLPELTGALVKVLPKGFSFSSKKFDYWRRDALLKNKVKSTQELIDTPYKATPAS